MNNYLRAIQTYDKDKIDCVKCNQCKNFVKKEEINNCSQICNYCLERGKINEQKRRDK